MMSDFSIRREEEFLNKVNKIQNDLDALKREIAEMHLAPSISTKIDDSFTMMGDYFGALAKHARDNLRPANFPRRR